ncbi:MAG: DUF2237 domain-containing protein [Verrucomicrobiota bacterium]
MPDSDPSSLNNVRNVLGTALTLCSNDPMTGYMRDGYCRRIPGDHGEHVVCAVVTAEFLKFSASCGNDLSTPMPAYEFPGLKPGDHWCLCLQRWIEAMEAGKAPKVDLDATHENVLEWVDLATLEKYKI